MIPCFALAFNSSLETAVSTARLATYGAVARDDDHAWELYRWNLDLAAAFTPLACDVEVALRNCIHDRLTNHFGRADWWAATNLVLDDITAETLASVVQRHQKRLAKGTVGPGKVVADLMLGTWVMLLSRGGTSALGRAIDYEANLWRPALRLGFATGTVTADGIFGTHTYGRDTLSRLATSWVFTSASLGDDPAEGFLRHNDRRWFRARRLGGSRALGVGSR